MKGLVVTGILSAFAPCSGPVQQSSTAPAPTPGSGTSTPASPTPTTPTTGAPDASGTTKRPIVCPSLQIKAPDVVEAGRSGRVSLIVTDAVPGLTYTWTVSAGSIESGQGTTAISVHTTNLWGASITVTVELGNLPTACQTTTASSTFLVGG